MSFHPGLVHEITTRPYDDAPKRIYLDWLKDEGNEPRFAELVELMQSDTMPLDSNWNRRDLQYYIPPAWGYTKWKFTQTGESKGLHNFSLKGRGRSYRGINTIHGWVSIVSCGLKDWLRAGKWLCERHPVSAVMMTSGTPQHVGHRFVWIMTDYIDRCHGPFVPEQIWNLLSPQCLEGYLTLMDAINDLGRAALLYGRKLAGHPVEVTTC